MPHSLPVEQNRSLVGSAGGRSMQRSYGIPDNEVQTIQPGLASAEIPNRSLLRSGHRKYPNHHLYSNHNPINNMFGMTEGAGNAPMFKKVSTNIFY